MIKLEQNYRSTSAILRAANNVIGPNPKSSEDVFVARPSRCAWSTPTARRRPSARARTHRGARRRRHHPGPQHKEFRDFAILYRANHQARVFEQALRKAQIPYKVSGGQSFFDRAEIKDLCGWFRLWVNNDDDPAFQRALGHHAGQRGREQRLEQAQLVLAREGAEALPAWCGRCRAWAW